MDINNNPQLHTLIHARCSTPMQVEYSVNQQLIDMTAAAQARGISVVDEIKLEGVSGYDPEARTDIDAIIKRKKEKDDFNAVMIASVDRLTRGGPLHGISIMWEFQRVGIRLISAKNDLPDGDYGWLYVGMKAHEAREEIKTLVRRLNGGMVASMLKGRMAHCKVQPYGCDRLVLSPEGEPLHRIRNLRDGTQQLLTVDGDKILRTFPKITDKKKSPHFKKQPTELVTFVPGDPAHANLMRRAYEQHYIDGVGAYTIVKRLNDEGVLSPFGNKWRPVAMKKLLQNPCFTGLGIANRLTNAGVLMRGKNGTAMVPPKTNKEGLNGRKLKFALYSYRPVDDWLTIPYPYMIDFLSNLTPEQRAEINRKQTEEYKRLAGQEEARKQARIGRHYTSSHFLTGILKSTDGCGMSGDRGKHYRYYRTTKAGNTPQTGVKFVCVAADLIEREVLSSVIDAVGNFGGLEEMVMNAAARMKSDSEVDGSARDDLRKQRTRLVREIGATTALNSDLDAKDIAEMIRPQKQALKGIDARLKAIEAAEERPIQHPGLVVANVKTLMKNVVEVVKNRELNPRFRNVVRLLVEHCIFDPEARTFDLRLSLPSWCLTVPPEEMEVRLASPYQISRGSEQNNQECLFLGCYSGILEKGHNHKQPKLTLHRVGSTPQPQRQAA